MGQCGGAVAWPVPTAASFPPTLRLLSRDSPTGQHRAVLSRCPQQGHELLEVTGLPHIQAQWRGYSASTGQWVLWFWCADADPHPLRCGAAVGAATVWTSRRWGSMGRSTQRVGPLPHNPAHNTGEGGMASGFCLPGTQLWLCQAGLWHPLTVPGPFACLAWSHSETQLLYVAERSRPKRWAPCAWDVPGAARPDKEQFVYHEDWGEALSTRSVPVLCALDLESSSLSVLEGIPEHLSPGQALWSPGDHGVVFVGWWHEPFRLGLSACSNRRSGIFHLDLSSRSCELLSAEHGAAFSPRLSPDGRRLLYLEGDVGGPHRQCLRLCMLTWQTRQTVTVLDVVQEPTEGESFAGLFTEVLPLRCWAADSQRVVLSTPQRSRTDLLLVDTEAATVTNLTAGQHHSTGPAVGAVTAAPVPVPPTVVSQVVAVLPPAGQELPLCWVPVEDTPIVPAVTWKTLTVRPPCSGQSPAVHSECPGDPAVPGCCLGTRDPRDGGYRGRGPGVGGSDLGMWPLPFTGDTAPMVPISPVNYRGSLGFGQASISSLLSRVGEQDVADTQLAVEQALHSEPLDPHRLALLAGSHGAFIALHLLTHEPKRYRACALRSPVSNLPALLGTSDIPDWRYTSLGLPYSFERVPHAEEVATMLLRSPIAQVQTPVLLCVGARDRRVSPTQAVELYRVLRARGVPVRLLWYPQGGHALAGVEMEADVFKNCAQWLLQHVGLP
uniref:Acylamino-acid-releasing enzyme n=1 Tax=Melopsittacus undulatus TaxID=13146 RepID=A0A8V5HB02_MELUD